MQATVGTRISTERSARQSFLKFVGLSCVSTCCISRGIMLSKVAGSTMQCCHVVSTLGVGGDWLKHSTLRPPRYLFCHQYYLPHSLKRIFPLGSEEFLTRKRAAKRNRHTDIV